MTTVLTYSPGQVATVVQEVLNLDGYRADGYTGAPIIARLFLPNLTLATTGYPVAMTKLDTGLYIHSFPLSIGATSVGSYLVDIYWYHPNTLKLQQNIIQIIANSPYGIYSVIPVG
jgi:hypothetical protein